jgi:hypothetical protein
MTPLAASISDATIWNVTFDDTRSVDYDRNSFIIQATDVNCCVLRILLYACDLWAKNKMRQGTLAEREGLVQLTLSR